MNTAPLLEEPDLVRYSEYDLPLYFNEKTDYRGPPTPEREILWEKLGPVRGLSMSRLLGETESWLHSNTAPEGAFKDPKDKLGILNKPQSDKIYKHIPPEVGTGYAA